MSVPRPPLRRLRTFVPTHSVPVMPRQPGCARVDGVAAGGGGGVAAPATVNVRPALDRVDVAGAVDRPDLERVGAAASAPVVYGELQGANVPRSMRHSKRPPAPSTRT